MFNELVAGVVTYRWLFTVALSVSGTATLLGLGLLLRVLRSPGSRTRSASGLLIVAGGLSGLWVVLATAGGTPLNFVFFEGRAYADDLVFLLTYLGGAVIGAALTVALVLAGSLIQRRASSGFVSIMAAALPAVAVASVVVALVLQVDQLTQPPDLHVHPPDTRFGNEGPADFLGSATFATDLVIAPSGEVFFAEHVTGRIGVLVPTADGGFATNTFGQVPIPPDGRLLHIALHPQWPSEPYLYATAHEGSGAEQRLAVFRLHADGMEADRVEPIIRGLPTEDPRRGPGADHFGSALAVCGDFLYLSVGDTDSPGPTEPRPGRIRIRAQLPDMAEGKILRYQFEGAALVPAAQNGRSLPVFAMGFRNVFAMDCAQDADQVIVADNGALGWDQVREVEAGSNHEWPLSNERVALTPPLYDTGPTSALGPTGVVLRGTSAGVDIWFSSVHTSSIYRLLFDDTEEHVEGVELIHSTTGGILSLADGPDGCLYFTTSNGIWRVRDEDCSGASGEVQAINMEGPAEIFATNCTPCHGLEREGGVGPPLTPNTLTQSDDFYLNRILKGVPGTPMPAWGEAGVTEELARGLIAYLRAQ